MIKVLVFDDNKNRRDSLETVLNMSDGFTCIGTFENCISAIEIIKENMPHIILMDIEMPEMNGIEATKIIKQQYPEIKIIIQTIFEDDTKIFSAIQNGAEGYILKNASVHHILESLNEVFNGGAYMTPSVAHKVMRFLNNQNKQEEVTKNSFNLSTRETEVLNLLTKGNSYKLIAADLQISINTVNSHIKKIYEKLHVHSVGEAIISAINNKLV